MPEATDADDEESPEYYARCPTCDFERTSIDADEARDLQYSGCPDCTDSRGLGVSTMNNYPE